MIMRWPSESQIQTIEVKKDQYIGLNDRWHMKEDPDYQGCTVIIDSLCAGSHVYTDVLGQFF